MSNYGTMLPALMLAGVMAVLSGTDARAQTANDLVCKRCVEKGDIAKNAVGRNRIRNNAVTGAKVKDGSIELEDLSPALQQAMANLQVLAQLAAFITVDEVETDLNGDGVIDPATERLPRVLFEGVNVQIVNGDVSQSTDTRNGLGNLIVGYNEPRTTGGEVCSDGEISDENGCEPQNVWALDHKSGSHNLVVGPGNAYSQTGGVAFGRQNAVTRVGAAVTGGELNIARGRFSSVSGGQQNTTRGSQSNVSGGRNNTASGSQSSVSGGDDNTASGSQSSVGGGDTNVASSTGSSVSGGLMREAGGTNDWAAGSLLEDF